MWRANVTIADGENHKATATMHLAAATTHAQATVLAVAFAALLPPIILGRIVSVELIEDLGLPAGNLASADLQSEVETKASFSFRTPVPGEFISRMSIPAINKPMVILPGSDLVNLADPEVDSLVSFMLNGVDVAGTVVRPRDARGDLLATLEAATEAWGKKRKKAPRKYTPPAP